MQWLGALIGGALELGGGMLQNIQQKKEATKNRVFQKYMSDTSYQRVMEDMRKAGLNPILAYKGAGASTPGGAMAPIQNIGKGAGATAMAIARFKEEQRNLKANTNVREEDYWLTRTQNSNEVLRNRILEQDLAVAKQRRFMSEMENNFYSSAYGRTMYNAEMTGKSTQNLGGALKAGAGVARNLFGPRKWKRPPVKTPKKRMRRYD